LRPGDKRCPKCKATNNITFCFKDVPVVSNFRQIAFSTRQDFVSALLKVHPAANKAAKCSGLFAGLKVVTLPCPETVTVSLPEIRQELPA